MVTGVENKMNNQSFIKKFNHFLNRISSASVHITIWATL